ncbi:hypothetical protein EMIT0P291_50074 [Pseudomonas sp. IT-P291]
MDRLHATATQGTLVIQRLQLRASFVFDALIEIGQLFLVSRVIGQAISTILHVTHDVVAQTLGTELGDGRDHVDRTRPFQAINDLLDASIVLFIKDLVALVQDQPAITLRQGRAELDQLVDDHFSGIRRTGVIQRRHVHEVQQQTRTRQVLEEANAQTSTFGSALDQTRNIGNDEALPAIDADHTQVRHQRGERVVGNFRLGGRYRTDKGTFTGIRQTQQTDVSQYFHFQLQVALLTRLARSGLARRTVGTGFETGVAQTVPAALHYHQFLTGLGQVADDLLSRGVDHRGADRNAQDQVFTLLAGAVRAAAVGATLGIEVPGVTVVHQGIEVFVGHHVDGTAVTAITAVRATVLDKFFPTETHGAIAAVTSLYTNRYFINKLHNKRLSPYGRAEKQSRHKTLAKMSAATPNHDTYIVRQQPIQTALQETHPTNEKAPSRDRAFPAIAQLSRDYAHVTTTEGAFYFELDHAFDLSEEGVIFTHANAVASVELGAALTHDDVACFDSLAAIHLHAKAFGF